MPVVELEDRHALAAFMRPNAPSHVYELGDLDEASSVHVEIDDVLEMSSFLTTFDGDFRRHFGDDGVIDGSTPA